MIIHIAYVTRMKISRILSALLNLPCLEKVITGW